MAVPSFTARSSDVRVRRSEQAKDAAMPQFDTHGTPFVTAKHEVCVHELHACTKHVVLIWQAL
jgi:hypothetical protein